VAPRPGRPWRGRPGGVPGAGADVLGRAGGLAVTVTIPLFLADGGDSDGGGGVLLALILFLLLLWLLFR